MRRLVPVIALILTMGNSTHLFSGNATEYEKAVEYLNKKGELYFKFEITSRSQIHELTRIISIDNVRGNEIFAYANENEFQTFLQHDLKYEVLTHPGDLLQNPPMSDYKNRNDRQWDSYPTYSAYVTMMQQFEVDYPKQCKLYNLGPSGIGDHAIYAVKISDNVASDEAETGFVFTATVNGDEVLNYVLMLHFIDTLLSSYSSDAVIQNLVDNIEIWVLPLCNPDATYKTGDHTVSGAQRRNVKDNFDLDRNFPCPCQQGDHKWYGMYNRYAKETEAIINFMGQHDFVMGADFHSGTECVIWPYGGIGTRVSDEDWFKLVAQQYADTFHKVCNNNGYLTSGGGDGIGHMYTEIYEAHGLLMDAHLLGNQCRALRLELSVTKILVA